MCHRLQHSSTTVCGTAAARSAVFFCISVANDSTSFSSVAIGLYSMPCSIFDLVSPHVVLSTSNSISVFNMDVDSTPSIGHYPTLSPNLGDATLPLPPAPAPARQINSGLRATCLDVVMRRLPDVVLRRLIPDLAACSEPPLLASSDAWVVISACDRTAALPVLNGTGSSSHRALELGLRNRCSYRRARWASRAWR